jgi:hypothetical protein
VAAGVPVGGRLPQTDPDVRTGPPPQSVMQSNGSLPVGATDGIVADGVFGSGYPACSEGMAPNLDRFVQVDRDCSRPDMSLVATAPWIVRGADMPLPSVAEAPVIDPVKFHRDELAAAHNTRIAAIATAGGAVALAGGGVLAYLKLSKASDRVDYDTSHPRFVSAAQEAADHSRMVGWELGTIGLAAGALISGVTSAHLWMNPPPVMVTPADGGGVALSYGGRF